MSRQRAEFAKLFEQLTGLDAAGMEKLRKIIAERGLQEEEKPSRYRGLGVVRGTIASGLD